MEASVLQDHSQTFVGVLASLLLITIIWSHESNFVMGIIAERSKEIKDIWRSLNDSISKRSKKWKFLNPDAEQTFNQMMKDYVESTAESTTNPYINEEIEEKLLRLDDKIQTGKEFFVTDYSRRIMPMIDRKIDSIKNSNKIIVSAIFALMSCLLIFIIDEIMAMFTSLCDYAASFLCLFLIIGSAFLLGMWLSFFIRHLPQNKIEENRSSGNGGKKTGSALILLPALTIWALLSCAVGSLLENHWAMKAIVIGVGMIIPVMLIGGIKVIGRDYSEKNPYSFSINHFLEFIALAIIWSVILFEGSSLCPNLSNVFFFYDDWTALLVFLEIYLLLIGIICPIFIPYLNTYILQWYMLSRLIEPKSLINKDNRWEELNQEITLLHNSLMAE